MKKLLVVLLVLGLAAPAMAQTNFSFYGSLRTHLGYYAVTENFGGGPAMDGSIAADTGNKMRNNWGSPDEGTVLSMSGQSRLGLRAFVSDKLMGVVEFGFTETTRSGETSSPYTRMAFGQWNFGAGTLIFGKHYTPASFVAYSGMVGDLGDQGEAVLLTAGIPYIGRQPQIRLTMMGFELALIERHTGAPGVWSNPYPPVDTTELNPVTGNPITTTDPRSALYYQDIDASLPRIELAYEFKTPMISVRPVFGYGTYTVNVRDFFAPRGTDDRRIDSYHAGLGLRMNFGPAYVNLTGSWHQNAGNYGQASTLMVSSLNNPVAIGGSNTSILNAQMDSNGNIQDSQLLQGILVAGFAVSPALRIEAGFGIQNAKVDADVGVELEQTGMVYYLQAPITIAKGFTLTPEIGQMDRGDLKVSETGFPEEKLDAGRMTYVVASLRIDF